MIQQQGVMGRKKIGQCVRERENSSRKNGNKRLGQAVVREMDTALYA